MALLYRIKWAIDILDNSRIICYHLTEVEDSSYVIFVSYFLGNIYHRTRKINLKNQ